MTVSSPLAVSNRTLSPIRRTERSLKCWSKYLFCLSFRLFSASDTFFVLIAVGFSRGEDVDKVVFVLLLSSKLYPGVPNVSSIVVTSCCVTSSEPYMGRCFLELLSSVDS